MRVTGTRMRVRESENEREIERIRYGYVSDSG